MAQTLGFLRSTSQVVTFDTINNLVSPLGPALVGVATTQALFPAKIQNTEAVYQGNPYAAVITTAGNIEIRVYSVGTGLWTLSSAVYTPVTLGALQSPICLQEVNNKLVAIWLESAAGSSIISAAVYDGVTWSTRKNTAANALLATSYGGNSVVWDGAVFFATTLGIGSFVPGTGFGSFDQGLNPAIINPLIDPITPQGCFAFWNNVLYFIKPATGLSAAILFSLNPLWDISLAPPQWNTVTGVNGIVTSGVMIAGNDIGNYCLFVNKQNQISLFHSGPSGTRLAVSATSAFPTFTDVTADLLPADIAMKTDLGVSLYPDDRRRLNEQQWFFLRDSSLTGNEVTLCKWDGVNPLVVQTSFPGEDYLLPGNQDGEPRTFTNVQPACYITDVNSGPYVTLTLTSAVGFAVGDIVQSVTYAVKALVTSLVGTTLVGKIMAGTWPTSGSITDTASATTTTFTGAVSAYVAPAFPGRAVITYKVRDTFSRNVDTFGEFSLDGVTWFQMTEGDGDDGSQAIASSPAGTLHTFYWDAFADLNGTYSDLLIRMIARVAVSVNEAPINPFVAVIQEGYLRPPVARNTAQQKFTFTAGSRQGVVVTLSGIVGTFSIGNTVTAGGSSGTITAVSLPAITVNETIGTFPSSGPITDTTTGGTATITSAVCFYVGETVTGGTSGATGFVQFVSPTTVTVSAVTGVFVIENITGSNLPFHLAHIASITGSVASPVVTTTTLPPDETTDLTEFHQVLSSVTRGHGQLMFQGRLSTNQTLIRFLKFTLRASAPTENAQIQVFVSGQGAANQYTGPFSTFTTLPTADTEVIIDVTQLLNQPSVTGKLYAVVVEFDLDAGQNAVVSTPFFRHE